jgi:hypothetical protein
VILYKCSLCGGARVQVLAWVDAERRVFEPLLDHGGWCPDCQQELAAEEINIGDAEIDFWDE